MGRKLNIEIPKDIRSYESSFDVMYPTGFFPFDFLNGYVVHVNTNDAKFKYNAIGIMDGTSNTIIGRSKCGKTTLALQMAGNITRPFKNSKVFYDDVEGGSIYVRRRQLLNFTDDEIDAGKLQYRNTGVTSETFFKRINEIYKEKTTDVEKYAYDTGYLDPKGRPIYKLEPTVYVLDSLAVLVPDNISEEEELSGSMSAAAIAKGNTAIYKRIIPKLKIANIIILAINHINDDININPFQHKPLQISGLRQGETMPGGKAVTYLANNLIRLSDSTKLKESDGFGINGSIVNIEIIKSRSNESNLSVPLVFDLKTGFRPEMSLLVFLKDRGIIPKGTYMTIPGCEDKFTQKTFQEKLYTNEEFRNCFMNVSLSELSKLLYDPDQTPMFTKSSVLMDSLFGMATQIQQEA